MDLLSSKSSPDDEVEVGGGTVEAIVPAVTMQVKSQQDFPKMADCGEFNKAKSQEVAIKEDESSKTANGNSSNLTENLWRTTMMSR